jgi:hypothetical protein
MRAPVTNAEVEDCLRQLLKDEGYSVSPKRLHGENGVDVIASRDSETYHIEVIGYKKVGAVRAKDFFEGFFRVVSRLNDGAMHCVLALSDHAKVGLPARAKQHRVAWLRIAKAFPELEVWLVDTENRAYSRTTWDCWVKEEAEESMRPVRPTSKKLAPVSRGKPTSADDPLWNIVGIASTAEPTDVSKKHEYLADAYMPQKP